MWRELIEQLASECEFYPPASRLDIVKAEHALFISLPDELKSLLSESNGIHGQYGLGLIWPLERIVKDNLSFRHTPDFKEMYMPFDPLLFFADAGNGDQFAFTIRGGTIRCSDVFVWNHEDDSRSWAAPSLKVYLNWWLSGRLKV